MALTLASLFLFLLFVVLNTFALAYDFNSTNTTASRVPSFDPLFEPFSSNSTLGYLLPINGNSNTLSARQICAPSYNYCSNLFTLGCCKEESECFVQNGVPGCKRLCADNQTTCADKTCCRRGYVCADSTENVGICEIDPRLEDVQLPMQIVTDNSTTTVATVRILATATARDSGLVKTMSSTESATTSSSGSGSGGGEMGIVVTAFDEGMAVTGDGIRVGASAVWAVVVGFVVLWMDS